VVLETGQAVTQVVRRAGKANRASTVDVGEALAEGYCTHHDARHLLESALSAHAVRDVLLARLAQTAGR
jgi:DNA helicase-2/ATP-dependent DNA helicase PcrA